MLKVKKKCFPGLLGTKPIENSFFLKLKKARTF